MLTFTVTPSGNKMQAFTQTHTHTHTHTHTRTHRHTHTHTYTHARAQARMHAHTHTHEVKNLCHLAYLITVVIENRALLWPLTLSIFVNALVAVLTSQQAIYIQTLHPTVHTSCYKKKINPTSHPTSIFTHLFSHSVLTFSSFR